MCVDYVDDIYAHLREAERAKRPDPSYASTTQKDVNAVMRGILVDWLVEVAEEYKLSADTLYLSVGYIDRVLSVQPVARTKLQLLGVVSDVPACLQRLREVLSRPGLRSVSVRDLANLRELGYGASGTGSEPVHIDE